MNSGEAEQKIKEVAGKIAEKFEPEQIILFGSHAWGEPGPDSDVDLLVIKKDVPDPRRLSGTIRGFLWGAGFPMDILVYEPERVIRNLQMGNFFIRDIITKGIILYDRR